MHGIFIRPSGDGYEVIRVDAEGHFPMDYYRHHTAALRYAKDMAKRFRLPVFVEMAK